MTTRQRNQAIEQLRARIEEIGHVDVGAIKSLHTDPEWQTLSSFLEYEIAAVLLQLKRIIGNETLHNTTELSEANESAAQLLATCSSISRSTEVNLPRVQSYRAEIQAVFIRLQCIDMNRRLRDTWVLTENNLRSLLSEATTGVAKVAAVRVGGHYRRLSRHHLLMLVAWVIAGGAAGYAFFRLAQSYIGYVGEPLDIDYLTDLARTGSVGQTALVTRLATSAVLRLSVLGLVGGAVAFFFRMAAQSAKSMAFARGRRATADAMPWLLRSAGPRLRQQMLETLTRHLASDLPEGETVEYSWPPESKQ